MEKKKLSLNFIEKAAVADPILLPSLQVDKLSDDELGKIEGGGCLINNSCPSYNPPCTCSRNVKQCLINN